MRIMLAILVALFINACAHTDEKELDAKLGSWVGQHPDRLVEAWGVPNSSYEFENGSKALTYEDSTTTTRSYIHHIGRPDYYTTSETCRINFYTDVSKQKIERFSYKGYAWSCLDIFDEQFKSSDKK